MNDLPQLIAATLSIGDDFLQRLLSSLLVVLFLWLLQWSVQAVIRRRTTDPRKRYTWRKTVTYACFLVGFILVLRIWFSGLQSLATFLGLVSAGLAIALKDIWVNLAGWIYLVWIRPFNVGDRIQVGTYSGDVIDIRPFQFIIMEIGNWVGADQSTGRIVHISNSKVFSDPIINYSRGFKYIWNELQVTVSFESNWRKSRQILLDIATELCAGIVEDAEKELREASDKYLLYYSVLTPTVFTTVKDNGVALTLRYLTKPHDRRSSENLIWERLLPQFNANDDIYFAYPTRRVYKYSERDRKWIPDAVEEMFDS